MYPSLSATLSKAHGRDTGRTLKPNALPSLSAKSSFNWSEERTVAQLMIGLFHKEGTTRDMAEALWNLYKLAQEQVDDWESLWDFSSLGKDYARVHHALKSRRPKTIKSNAYLAHIFVLFCHVSGVRNLNEVQEADAVKWLEAESERGISESYSTKQMNGVKFLFRLSDPKLAKSTWITDAMAAIAQANGTAANQSEPMLPRHIRKMARVVAKDKTQYMPHVLALAAAILGFAANMRGEQIWRLTWNQLRIASMDDLAILRFVHAKTKSTNTSQQLFSSMLDQPETHGASILALLDTIARNQGGNSQWIFAQFTGGVVVRMKTQSQSYYYKKLAKLAGIKQWNKFGGHSPRVGAATWASVRGVPWDLRRVHGKWSRKSQMPDRYDASKKTVDALVSLQLAGGKKLKKKGRSLRKLREKIVGWNRTKPWYKHRKAAGN